MKLKPKVSVITFAYVNNVNGRYELLVECIESIIAQKYENYEHIIIDDGSDVDLSHLKNEYPNIKYYKKLGTGILSSTYTFNMGHELASGKYCIYLPSDDLHEIGAIKGLVSALENESEEVVMAIGNAVYEYDDGRVSKWQPDKNKIEESLGEGNHINGCAVMWKKNSQLLDRLPPNFTGFCCDYDLWVTIAKMGKVIYPDIDVVRYRHVEDSTRNKTRSKFIVSPRKEDKVFYQYSKASRIEFVKMRHEFSVDQLQNRRLDPIDKDDISILNLDMPVSNTVYKAVQKRQWKLADDLMTKSSEEYREIKKEAQCLDLKYTARKLNILYIILMRSVKVKDKFYIYDDLNLNSWIIDMLPIPYIAGVLKNNHELNEECFSYLGAF
ncbi:Glycosyltransferase [Marinomonas sp. MED121]|uniref:glycosyltransferase family 2 protein n=1 Tax=Marinomonas sp. MED121 TaxID=314277 RepID=UPI0000690089|nr:glycosyltransferase [Marinomonas sp. MED121]EAQ65697.1 Glycosyltransferase [Marinomonas sp. MED121]